MKVVLVTGGRAYDDWKHVYDVLDGEKPDLVMHGGCKTMEPGVVYGDWSAAPYIGADYIASEWCDFTDTPQLKAPYLRKLGKQGGPARNTWMIGVLNTLRRDGQECVVISFPGGSGTADTIDKAIRAGFTVRKELPR